MASGFEAFEAQLIKETAWRTHENAHFHWFTLLAADQKGAWVAMRVYMCDPKRGGKGMGWWWGDKEGKSHTTLKRMTKLSCYLPRCWKVCWCVYVCDDRHA